MEVKIFDGQIGHCSARDLKTLTVDGDVPHLDVVSVLVFLVAVARVGYEAAQGRAVVTRL